MIFVTLGCNFREDPESAKDFLKVAAQLGVHADCELKGRKAPPNGWKVQKLDDLRPRLLLNDFCRYNDDTCIYMYNI